MRHAAVAVMFTGLAVLALVAGFVAGAKPVDAFDEAGYVMHESAEDAMDYALRNLAVMDSIARVDSTFIADSLDTGEPFGGWDCGQ